MSEEQIKIRASNEDTEIELTTPRNKGERIGINSRITIVSKDSALKEIVSVDSVEVVDEEYLL